MNNTVFFQPKCFILYLKQKDVYRCSNLKYRAEEKCDSVIRIVIDEGKYIIEHNQKQHSCDDIQGDARSKATLSDDVVKEIRLLYIAHVRQPKRVMVGLREIQKGKPELYTVEPTTAQIKYQVAKLKAELYGKGEISLSELEKFLAKNSAIPDGEDDAFVIGHKVRYAETDLQENSDSDSSADNEETGISSRHFWMLFATKRLLKLASNVKLICADTTFKFVWLGFPAILIGTVDSKKQFHPIAFGITSSENTVVFVEVFKVS